MADGIVTTSWMWATSSGGVNGVEFDTDQSLLMWYDEMGCACGDSSATQTPADFLTNGPRFSNLPADVQQEITTSLEKLGKQ